MNWMRKITIWLLSWIVLTTGCQSNEVKYEESLENERSFVEIEQESSQIEESEVEVEEMKYEISSLTPETTGEKQYDWVIIQHGRKVVNQNDVEEINRQLQLEVDDSIAFHIVTLKDYVTPEVLREIYEQLEGNMDYISFGDDLCAFVMKEWRENFKELSEEMVNGKLHGFYEAVPEVVWKANNIDGGIYSFSNATTISVRGYGFSSEVQEKYGKDQLIKLLKTNGVENEEVWKEFYDLHGESICMWSALSWGVPVYMTENPYVRATLSQFANGFEEQYFVRLTDDIRFDIEKEEFVWLPENEKYITIKQDVADLYEKGYLCVRRAMTDEPLKTVISIGNTANSNEVYEFGEETDALWVPLQNQAMVTNYQYGNEYMYSMVYKEAEEGWEEVLNVIGTNEQITDILNKNDYDMTISSLVFGEREAYYTLNVDDEYEMIQTVYEEAKENPIAGFIFNPLPIRDEWEEYNRLSATYAGANLTVEPKAAGDLNEPNFETIDMIWNEYQSMKEDAHIQTILQELNRQYTEWRSSLSE